MKRVIGKIIVWLILSFRTKYYKNKFTTVSLRITTCRGDLDGN
ncbi:hypothetical protein [Clostridium sp.]